MNHQSRIHSHGKLLYSIPVFQKREDHKFFRLAILWSSCIRNALLIHYGYCLFCFGKNRNLTIKE